MWKKVPKKYVHIKPIGNLSLTLGDSQEMEFRDSKVQGKIASMQETLVKHVDLIYE